MTDKKTLLGLDLWGWVLIILICASIFYLARLYEPMMAYVQIRNAMESQGGLSMCDLCEQMKAAGAVNSPLLPIMNQNYGV